MSDTPADATKTGSLGQAAGDVAREAVRSVDSAAKHVEDHAAQAGDKAQAATEDVRRRMADASAAARDWAADQSDVIRDTVQTKPFISVGVSAASAFAAGLVLGVLLTRR